MERPRSPASSTGPRTSGCDGSRARRRSSRRTTFERSSVRSDGPTSRQMSRRSPAGPRDPAAGPMQSSAGSRRSASLPSSPTVWSAGRRGTIGRFPRSPRMSSRRRNGVACSRRRGWRCSGHTRRPTAAAGGSSSTTWGTTSSRRAVPATCAVRPPPERKERTGERRTAPDRRPAAAGPAGTHRPRRSRSTTGSGTRDMGRVRSRASTARDLETVVDGELLVPDAS
jgi:hypothetical protein